jgi:DNA repair protein RadC
MLTEIQDHRLLHLHQLVDDLFADDTEEDQLLQQPFHEAIDQLQRLYEAAATSPEPGPSQLEGVIEAHARTHARHHGPAATRAMLMNVANRIHTPPASTLPAKILAQETSKASTKRAHGKPALVPPKPVTLTETACHFIDQELAWLSDPARTTEHFTAFAIDANGEICGRIDRSSGQSTWCAVGSVEGIVREALSDGAKALWCVHNHLQQDVFSETLQRHWASAIEPSASDISTTNALKAACEQSGVAFIDHLVVGPNAREFSFAEAERPILTTWDVEQRKLDAQPTWFLEAMAKRGY